MPRSRSTNALPSDVRAGYYVIGYSPEDCVKRKLHEEARRREGKTPDRQAKPKRISGLLETKAGADDYAALIRKWGGVVITIEATLKG